MWNKEKNFVSAVIYVHNAGNRISTFLKVIMDTLEKNFECSEIICVNDSSDDKSVEEIRKMSKLAVTTSISVVNMSYFHGIELSMNAGVDLAIGDFVFEFDNTNLDFDGSTIMEVYHRCLDGFDLVSALSNKKEKKSSAFFYNLFDQFADMPYKMKTEHFRILSRRLINRINSVNKMIPYRKAAYAGCGLKAAFVAYKAIGIENKNTNKKERQYRSDLAVDSLILFTKIGYRFSRAMTIVMMLMSVFTLVYSLTIYLTAHPVAGWTTIILFLSFAFFCLFGILTIIVKYLQLLVDITFKRKHYNFESIEKMTK